MSTTVENHLTVVPSEDEDRTVTLHLERSDDWKVEVYRVEGEQGIHIDVETFDVFNLETLEKFGAAVLSANAVARQHEEA